MIIKFRQTVVERKTPAVATIYSCSTLDGCFLRLEAMEQGPVWYSLAASGWNAVDHTKNCVLEELFWQNTDRHEISVESVAANDSLLQQIQQSIEGFTYADSRS